ncbi:Serine phosphatase RsbU, regulator of sigma subunit [Jatrophihabitans endophyticus]|uniref:Serine phosphatase RsbU, regulator of sigma subunit n=1 Tax=Jatrophihabitans endophyticus TaxID=1206085 RepID=A0A1M5HJN7_9ACTN|nr:SpoIIE family protein phosphatase [Jatrophihabitans endophyticus]SHG16189.1 Serine phosphatase RsbU, regulator of sigma subunit [Jatrophihabitans endophyticus]
MACHGEADDLVTGSVDLGDVVADSSIGLLGLDAAGTISVLNRHLAELVARPAAELVGRSPHDVFHGADHGPSGCPFRQARELAAPIEVEGDSFATAGGELVPVTWIAAPLRGGAGTSIVVRDDSAQRVRGVVDAAVREQGRADLAEARQSVSDLEWLAELTQSMSSSLDEAEVLLRLARILAGRLAEVVIVDLHTGGGAMRRVGGAVAPGVELDLDAILGQDHIGRVVPAASASSGTMLQGAVVRLDGAELDDPAVLGDSSRALMCALGASSVLVVPLVTRERAVGAFALVRRTGVTPFDGADATLVEDIARRAALAVDNARLYREQRDVALQLQHALLPSASADLVVDTAVRYLPSRARYRVGGDWYDRFACPSTPGRTVLVVGDVAGHDLPAAATMAAVRNLLRGIAVATDKSCAGVIEALDGNLAALSVVGTASVVLMTVDAEPEGDWTLTWTNAGHPPPLLLLPDGGVELLDEVHGPILGTRSSPRRGESTRRVPGGSAVVLYTDGLIETRGESIDVGLTRLRQSATAVSGLRDRPEELLDELLRRNHPTDEDDTAVLVCSLPVSR